MSVNLLLVSGKANTWRCPIPTTAWSPGQQGQRTRTPDTQIEWLAIGCLQVSSQGRRGLPVNAQAGESQAWHRWTATAVPSRPAWQALRPLLGASAPPLLASLLASGQQLRLDSRLNMEPRPRLLPTCRPRAQPPWLWNVMPPALPPARLKC